MSHGKHISHVTARSFFWQVPGAMTPWIVALCLILTDISPNNKWRIVLGLGGIPATVVVILVYHEMGLEAEAKHQTRKDSFNVAQMQRGMFFSLTGIVLHIK